MQHLFPRFSCRPLASVVLALLVAGCAPEKVEESAIVATIGDAVVRADDFAKSFELGFPHLKRGDDPRRAYLSRVIDEKLLALEGYRLSLDTTEAVRAQIDDLRDELLVEQIFEREVNAHVTVSDEEIAEALQRDGVRFRLRYVPTATREQAEQVRRFINTDGFDAALAQQLARRPEAPFRAEDFVTPYLTAAEIPPALLEGLQNLPVGVPSAPLPVAGQFLIAEVLDIRREPLVLDADTRTRTRQVLFQQKARQAARAYVTSRMEPLEVRVKAGVFRELSRTLWSWYRTLDGPPLRLSHALAGDTKPEAAAVRARLDDVLATTRDSSITVRALLAAFPARRYALSTKSEDAFQGDLYDAIGLALRDATFLQQAHADKLVETPAVVADLARWTDKWVYQALLHHLADTVQVTEADVETYRTRHAAQYDALTLSPTILDVRVRDDVRIARVRAALPDVLRALRQQYPVTIHDAALDAAVSLEDAATPGLPVMLFKAHTGRPLYPVVDPAW